MYCYDIIDGTRLEAVLRLGLTAGANKFLVTATPAIDARGRASYPRGLAERVRGIFKRKLKDEFNAISWPGTRLSKSAGKVFVCDFDAETIDLVLATERDLFKWTQNRVAPLPENICLIGPHFRYPLLVSVTHESDAWVIVERPLKQTGLKPSRFRPDELFISRGPFFCEAKPS